ncbi:hypothetical protein RJ639_020355 [Escallonia herrerae]|uniref:Cyclic nucleotide-binding domain-containing protein n=1 Tax=Escallonia herrerae TaxID=1293975 RepID=A0AA89AG33_9ASTE|nr:hypothetical protein RJ639_020355 [Escallonia herrerae]
MEDDSLVWHSVECYACTQVGVPVFHSTSCDRAHQPEWEASAGSSLIPIQNQSTGYRWSTGPFGGTGPEVQARAEVEPGVPAGACDGAGRRSAVLLRALHRPRRLAGISGGWLWEARVGRTCHRLSLRAFSQGVLVRFVRDTPRSSASVTAAIAVFLIYPIGQGSFEGDLHIFRDPPDNMGFYFFSSFQAVFWLLVPRLIREEEIKLIMTILLLIFLFQFLPKAYHCISLMRRMQKVTGFVFGSIWWGFSLNLIAYFIASHVAGGCWYVLAIQRVASCLRQQCDRRSTCKLSLSCSEEVCYQFLLPKGTIGNPCGGNSTTVVRRPMCLDINGPFKYGIYQGALPVISSGSLNVKILYPIFWGLYNLSTFGNDLEPTSRCLEVIFSICIVLSGLMLFTLLIGNIQVFLQAVMAKKRNMQLRCRDLEWWMRRRQLPSRLRQRVRHFERQRWTSMGGVDEMELVKDLPEGLRRDIKRFLCIDLIKKVPLFRSLDELILDNICDRVKPLVFSKDEKIIREGDPVRRIVFIVRGRIKSIQNLSKDVVATSILEPGGFLGDELLSWSLRRPFKDRLPASSATFVCTESAEAFGLDANDLHYVTDHFRYKFGNEKIKRIARYYSSNWRTWAAVNIQLAWRRYALRARADPVNRVMENGAIANRLLQCAAMFLIWMGMFRRLLPQPDSCGEENLGSNSATECYACTQVGVPVFHSTSCDRAHQPEWEACAGSSLIPIQNRLRHSSGYGGSTAARFGRVLDPRSKRVQKWNRAFVLARGMALAVDPLFFYALSIGRGGSPCLHMDTGVAATVTMLRTCLDAVHLCHLWLQFRLAYVSKESLVAIFWVLVPRLIGEEEIVMITTILQLIFLFQFLPKVYHTVCLVRRMQKVTGYIFGTIWWGFAINLIAYFLASHVFGGCCTFGNTLEPSSNWLEVIFCICTVVSGLMLFTWLIGNVQVFLHVVMATKRKMQLRYRDMEWWMRRRQLPAQLRQRVRYYEGRRLAAMGGEDEMQLIQDLPEGLRRDIKRFLCLELIKKVPLFQSLDDLILDNICDRIKPLVYSKDEKILREGDPVKRIVFIVRGHIKGSQNLSKGMIATSMIDPGGFLGDELLSWSLRRPFTDRLPASSATFTCIESTEAFGLDANNLHYITDHFRYKFANERLKRTARYYSSNWRTWAAVNIQLAWRRYVMRTRWLTTFRGHKTSQPDVTRNSDNPTRCYACTRDSAPPFHSTSCDPAHQPQWQALAGSSLLPIQTRSDIARNWSADERLPSGPFGRVLDPRSKAVRWLNRVTLLARGLSLTADPLFFFAISVGGGRPCIYVDGGVVAAAAVLRTCADAVHLCHLWLQFRVAYVSRESLVVGCGRLVWDARAVASRYVRSVREFWFDAFVILPIPQVVYWLVVPKLLSEDNIEELMKVIQFIFLLQFLPKVYHGYCLMRGMRSVTGYIFGTIWWGLGLNLFAYFLASHATGGYWYILAIRRIASCLMHQCKRSRECSLSMSCSREVCYRFFGNSCGGDPTKLVAKLPLCLDDDGPFPFGIYKQALPLMSRDNITIKILYSNLWGLMVLSTMGNVLEPTSQCLEVIFAICMVFLHAVMARRRKMQLRYRDMEWWMRRRQLPSHLRQRVLRFENQRWAAMGGQDETKLIKDLPDGIRRDIKRYLCLDLIKKVHLFHNLDDVILDNICDRVKPLIYSKGEKVFREGDPVQQMVFVVRGRIQRSQSLGRGILATSTLEPGGFLGDELLSWCLRRPFTELFPASTATFTCVTTTEAFVLEADHLVYITNHFRYNFVNEKLKQMLRYYSSNWRTWAAVTIQFAWQRYKIRTRGSANLVVMANGGSERRLRQFAAVFMSLRPHDHLE